MADQPAEPLSRPLREPSDSPPVWLASERNPAIGFPPEVQPRAPVHLREIIAVALLVVLADLTIYRGEGYAGFAALFAAVPVLLTLGASRPRGRMSVWLIAGLLLLLAAKLLWCGHVGMVAIGFWLSVALAMALAGWTPYILEMGLYALQTPVAGWFGLADYVRSAERLERGEVPRGAWLSIALPIIALLAFGSLFVLANPDLVASFSETLRRVLDSFGEWVSRCAPSWSEILFWVAAAWLIIGLLRPILPPSGLPSRVSDQGKPPVRIPAHAESPLYAAFRNTLVTVIVLFAVYLVFEFKTLWFREFPQGFYYAGYAHEGAAWLTAALALSTVVLSLVFRGSVLGDPRLPRLRTLAWFWSAENLLLAAAVYNRMHIYVDFNGMTRMRTLGLFGITTVVVGFLLVVWKIAHNRDFVWLMRRHLWALALALYLLAITPVDPLIHSYNVRRVLADDLAPVVQISAHPISSEGILVLHPLLQSRNDTIREGIRAMFAERMDQLMHGDRQQRGWTAFQVADRLLLRELEATRGQWQLYTDRGKRAESLERFHKYAYQWY